MPVTAGQLALFANDSTAAENWLLAALRPDMPSTEAMVEALVEAGDADAEKGRPDSRQPRRHRRTMSVGSRRVLEEECRTYAAYLLGTAPGAYVREQYVRAAYAHDLALDEDFTRFDRITLAVARKGRPFARCADAYCALFHPRGALRRKLIVLAAILEHVAPTSEAFDRTSPKPAALAVLSLAAYSSIFAVSLLLGAVVLAPASVLCWIADLLDARQHPREAG
jgi:hypothetical protein